MARATTKEDLLKDSQLEFDRLMNLINKIPQEHLDDPFNVDISNEKQAHWKRDENIKDVIVHLFEWQNLLLEWICSNREGVTKQFLREGYNWRTYGDMNQVIKEEHAETSLSEALDRLSDNHQKLITLLNDYSNEELFSKNVYPWVGGSTLGSYFVSTMASHYTWAYKKINKFYKSL